MFWTGRLSSSGSIEHLEMVLRFVIPYLVAGRGATCSSSGAESDSRARMTGV